MSDDLDDLKAAMKAATPAPDAARKAAHLALAQKNFADLQGSREEARPKSDRPGWGLWTGARQMLNFMTTRGGLTATTALVAIGFVSLTPLGERLLTPRDVSEVIGTRSAPEVEPVAAKPEAARAREEVQALADSDSAVESAPVMGGAVSAEAPPPPAAAPMPGRLANPSDRMSRGVQLNVAPMAEYARPMPGDMIAPPEQDTEAFANAKQNPLKITAEEPVSTFSIDVDTASYSVVRNSLTNGMLPPPDAVRVEEMVNYFPYDYAAPEAGQAFRPTVSVSPTPWNAGTKIVQIGIQGAMPAIADRPALNLVFLVDTSGSMEAQDKLPLLKQSFALMLGQLRPEDQVAIVAYAGSAGEVLAPTKASERDTILAALNRLSSGGSTAGQEGLQQAYAVAESMKAEGEVSRVILATDGDFNVGLSDPEALKTYIEGKRKSGTYLSVLGFGRGNLDDATMQALAQNGNGTAAYIDTLSEAQKVLVDQLSGALFPIADDVKIQVEFNPATVAEYRLIGYETRALNREDFNNDRVDAGDIGAGTSVTALYEITPVGSPAQLTEPLRYQPAGVAQGDAEELGFLRLRYKAPGEATSQLIEMPITADLPPQGDAGFAIAIAGFGQLLRGSSYLGDWSWGDAIALANANKGADPYGYRAEAVQLMRLAQSLSAR
ncbi:von Willebrand factor type A domain-containing protein [Seohaeicola nanhaiensis]|uniref:von Willebrand factor type A domain-containing protein n=1 Tax=Seohaeicola nanhaiensis TaxID=1387282 RepID=A0ABV9KFR0_9RHOB